MNRRSLLKGLPLALYPRLSMAAGKARDGRTLGLNLSADVYDQPHGASHENALFVDGVTCSVSRGEVLGFLGPNGAGKSTTMKMIAGFLAPSAGSIRVCGCDVQTATRDGRRARDRA